MMQQTAITNPSVQAVFDDYSGVIRDKLFALRDLIFGVVAENPEIGDIEETLKWGQISYRPIKKRVGTTIRIGQQKDSDTGYALYVPCSTSLLDTYRQMFSDTLEYEGDRAILLSTEHDIPEDLIKQCIHLALTYHLNK